MKPDFSPWKLNNCYLTIFLPINGEQEIVKIACASFRYKREGLNREPYIIVNFDWEDENRKGAPEAVKQALIAFEFMNYRDCELNTLKVKQFSSNSIIITGLGIMDFHIDTPSPNPMI